MGRPTAYSKMTKKKQEAITNDIAGHTPYREISERYGTGLATVSRIRNNEIPDIIAKADADKAQAVIDTYIGRLEKKIGYCETMADSVDEELRQGRTDGKYDLSDVGKALALSRMMHDAIKSLREVVMDILKIQGNIKETAEIHYNPTLILKEIIQVIQVSESKEDIIARLEQLKSSDR